MTASSRGGTVPARRSRANSAALIARVQKILQETCEQDGQGSLLQESSRRKAYRAGINRALREIETAGVGQDRH